MKIQTLFFALIIYFQASAQTTYSISGYVKDKQNQPLEYINIVLLSAKDSVFVKAVITDSAGNFKIDKINIGKYLIKASCVGYQTYVSPTFQLDSANVAFHFNSIVLNNSDQMLNEITILSRKPLIEMKPDKMVINVANSLLATGSTTLDLLGKLPGLAVSPDGTVSMKNKVVTVFINGRPTYLTGSDLAAYLNGLNGESIEKVELISNPSSKYDAAGSGGIVNIILKKDQKLGFNGNLNATYRQAKYASLLSGLNLNYQAKDFNLYGTLSNNLLKQESIYSSLRNFNSNDNASRFDQHGNSISKNKSQMAKIGLDYYLSKKLVFGFLANGILNRSSSVDDNLTRIKNNADITNSSIKSLSLSNNKWQTYSFNTNLKYSVDTLGSELRFDADYVKFNRNNNIDYYNDYLDANGLQQQPTGILLNLYPGYLDIKTLKIDYTHNLKNSLSFGIGAKGSWVKNDNDLRFFDVINGNQVNNSTLSNHFVYEENINAFYLNASKEFKKFSFQLGLRAEQTNTTSTQLNNSEVVKRNYFELFPSVFITYKPIENHQFGLNFTRRINRPSYQRLNPYKKIYDPLNYETGNPYLNPSFSNDAEINYTFKNNLTIGFSYGYEDKTATNIILQDEQAKTTITTFGNLAKAQGGGATLSYNGQIGKWFTYNNFVGLFFNRFQGPYLDGYLNIFKSTFNFNGNYIFNIDKTWQAAINLNYLGGQQQGLQSIETYGLRIDPSIQKTFFNKKLSIKAGIGDLLKAYQNKYSTKFQSIDTKYESFYDSRRYSLSFSWNFGKNTIKQARNRRTSLDEQKQRVEQ